MHEKKSFVDMGKQENNDWYFTKEEIVRGLSVEELKQENQIRRNTCAFIQEAGMKLGLYSFFKSLIHKF